MSSINTTQYPPPPLLTVPPEALPDLDKIVVQDDTPVDSLYAEKLMRLLVASFHCSYPALYPGRQFLAMANVGLFHTKDKPPVVPDVMVSLDIEVPTDVRVKEHRSYFAWIFGKMPDATVEIVSNTEGHELDLKFELYEHLGIPYYAVWDPEHYLGSASLRCFSLRDRKYQENGQWMPGIGVGVKEWHGEYEGSTDTWLRWCDQQGNLLLTPEEQIAKLKEQIRALGAEPHA